MPSLGRLPFFLFCWLLACPASAQENLELRRGPIEMRVNVKGTVVPEDVFRLKSSIDGRVEAVLASSYTWSGPDTPLALVVDGALSALIDSRQTTPTEVLAKRWQNVFQPNRVKCIDECFVLAVYARPKKRVLPQAVLFEAAEKLRLVGRVRPEDRHWIKEGQRIDFWPVSDPQFKQSVKIDEFLLDVQGQKAGSGGTLRARLSPKATLDPGTAWVGTVLVSTKRSALRVPTKALIQYKGSIFLPVEVSTGITTEDLTEITGGIEEKRHFLLLQPGALHGAEPYHTTIQPLPPPRSGTFIDDSHGGNRALDDSTYDKPAGDEDE